MLRKVMPLLLGAAVGLLVGWGAVRLFEQGSGEIEAIRGAAGAFGAWTPAIVLAAAALMAMFAILLHEFGHILGALAVRSAVTRLYWGPFIVLFPERRIRFTFRNKWFFGAMQADLQPYRDEASFRRAIRAQRFVSAAGPAFSLLTGLAAYVFAPQLWSLAGLYAVLSIGIGLATLLSDGVNTVLLGRRNHALVLGWTVLIQGKRIDEDKLAFLQTASRAYLRELAATPPKSAGAGRELNDLYVLYYVKWMGGREEEAGVRQLTAEAEAAWNEASAAKLPKARRDALLMVLGEEVVRLQGKREEEQAQALYARLEPHSGSSGKPSPLLLKARAVVQRQDGPAAEYLRWIRSLSGDVASYGVFLRIEEQQLRRGGLLNNEGGI